MDEASICVPFYTKMFSSMQVSHTMHPRDQIYVDPRCAICYGSVWKGLGHVTYCFMLQPTTDSRLPQEFPIKSAVTFSCKHQVHNACIVVNARINRISFPHGIIQTFMVPGVIFNNTAPFKHNAEAVYNSSFGKYPAFATCKMRGRETYNLPTEITFIC